jgi:Holliday junction resolvase RusA-like endonuclease
MMKVQFTVYAKPVPQGSMKGFVLPGKNGAKARAIITSDNTKLKPYRGEVTREAMMALANANLQEPMAEKHVPVSMTMDFYLARPASIPKSRKGMVVKPDIDKLARGTIDSLTGILFCDDAQIVEMYVRKLYGSPERVVVSVAVMDDSLPLDGQTKGLEKLW